MLCPLYISEIAPPSSRGALLALEQLSIVTGVVLGFWTGFWTRNIGTSASWRIPLGIQLIPGLLLSLGCAILPSSPRLLVLKGMSESAKDVLMKLRDGDEELIQLEILEMRAEVEFLQRTRSSSSQTPWRRLFDKRYISRTSIGVLIMFFQRGFICCTSCWFFIY